MASELCVLWDATHTGTQNAGTMWRPSPSDGGGELDADEVAEVVYVEIFSPTDGTGNAEDLRNVWLVLDGRSYRDYVVLNGRYDANMGPSIQHLHGRGFVAFGKGLREALKSGAPLLENTTPKARRSITVYTEAGSSNITGDYRIRVWGYRYKKPVLEMIVGGQQMPGDITIIDVARGRVVQLQRKSLPIDYDHWTQLPGGLDQETPAIHPFFRHARNAQQTTPNTTYDFRFSTGKVATDDEDLFFPYDVERKTLLIRGLGVRAAANLRYAWVEITADPNNKEHPKGKVPVSEYNNVLHFGHGYPLLPANLPLYYPIPAWRNKPLLIHEDKAFVAIQDNGTPVSANAVTVALNGVLIERGAA